MNEAGSSPGDGQIVRSQGAVKYDPFGVERRRHEVARLRYTQALTEDQIRDELAKMEPPITCSLATISRDLHAVRKQFRHYLSVRGFDAADEVFRLLSNYEEREHLAMKYAREKGTDPKGRAALIRTANECARLRTRLLQETGLLDRKLGTFVVEDGRKAERVPSGTELVKRLGEITVSDGEIVSEAEFSYLHGDERQSLDAAEAATDGIRQDAETLGD